MEYYNLRKNPAYLYLKGSRVLEFSNTCVHVADIFEGIGLTFNGLNAVPFVHLEAQTATAVEKLTTSYAAPSEGGVVLNLGAFPNAARTYFLRMGKGKQAGCCLFSLWRFGPYGFLILESLKQKRNSVCPNSNGSFHAASLFSSRALSFAVCERPENYVLTFAVRISRDI